MVAVASLHRTKTQYLLSSHFDIHPWNPHFAQCDSHDDILLVVKFSIARWKTNEIYWRNESKRNVDSRAWKWRSRDSLVISQAFKAETLWCIICGTWLWQLSYRLVWEIIWLSRMYWIARRTRYCRNSVWTKLCCDCGIFLWSQSKCWEQDVDGTRIGSVLLWASIEFPDTPIYAFGVGSGGTFYSKISKQMKNLRLKLNDYISQLSVEVPLTDDLDCTFHIVSERTSLPNK